MSQDWYLDAIERVQSSAAVVHQALDHVVETLAHAGDVRLSGGPLSEIVEGLSRNGAGIRRAVDDAFRLYADSITAYRSTVIRALVDDEGMTHADIARMTGVSRQMVGRLYHGAPARESKSALPAEDC
ncbi:MAG TPA: hypothetical protein VGP92_18720 [Acidimicrobiia bacterium]|nr:hypothetical protein [Acidimicrobiia bacterium]